MKNKAFTTIELIFAISVASIMLIGLMAAVSFNVKTATYNKAKLGAQSVLTKELEKVRAMKYINIGLISGNPSGNLNANDSYVFNNVTYNISREVLWIDNPKDGIGALDSDNNPNDFKQVKITVSWVIRKHSFSVSSLTYVYGYE